MDIVAARYQAGCASTNAASAHRLSASRSGMPGRIPRAIASGEQSSTSFFSSDEPPTTTGRPRSDGSWSRSTSTRKWGMATQATRITASHFLELDPGPSIETQPLGPPGHRLLDVDQEDG